MTINKFGFEFQLNVGVKNFRMSLIKFSKKTAFIIFIISFGVMKNPLEYSVNEYMYFYFDYPREYKPGRESFGFKIKLK